MFYLLPSDTESENQGQVFQVDVLLGQHWLDAVVGVHCAAREALPDSQKHFLLPKEKAYFARLLEGKGGAIIASFDRASQQVSGLCAVIRTGRLSEACANKAITVPAEIVRKGFLNGSAGVNAIQSFCVHPDYKKQDVSQGVLSHALLWHEKNKGSVLQRMLNGASELVAQVAADNTCAILKFMRAGYVVEATWGQQDQRGIARQKLLVRQMPSQSFVGKKEACFVRFPVSTLEEREHMAQIVVNHVACGKRAALVLPTASRSTEAVVALVPR